MAGCMDASLNTGHLVYIINSADFIILEISNYISNSEIRIMAANIFLEQYHLYTEFLLFN